MLEAKRMIDDGPAGRRDFISLLVNEAGGSVEGMWLTNVGDWDLVCLIDMGDQTAAVGAAATMARRAAGLTERERWIELIDIDDVANAIDAMAGTST